MCNFTSSLHVKGWPCQFTSSSHGSTESGIESNSLLSRRRMSSDEVFEPLANAWHSSNTKQLKARMTRTSACQSCSTFPLACGSLDEGRHFIPVLRTPSCQSRTNIDYASYLVFERTPRLDMLICHLVLRNYLAIYYVGKYLREQNELDIPSATMPLRGTHSWRPLSRMTGLRLFGNLSNSRCTKDAIASEWIVMSRTACPTKTVASCWCKWKGTLELE